MLKKAIKRLGQNFLIDANVRFKILKLCDFKAGDRVIEIGAGRGEMTALIAKAVSHLSAIELDKNLTRQLNQKFKNEPNISIINADFLKINLNPLIKNRTSKLKIFGNIPYYITTPIIERVIEQRCMIDQALIMCQKEFAQRIIAGAASKHYGSLSCFVQYYTKPEILCSVSKNSFFPIPKVDSCFIRLKILERPLVKCEDEELMFKIIRAGFNQRRKTLRSSLKKIVKKDSLEQFLKEYLENINARPENLSLEQFAALANSA